MKMSVSEWTVHMVKENFLSHTMVFQTLILYPGHDIAEFRLVRNVALEFTTHSSNFRTCQPPHAYIYSLHLKPLRVSGLGAGAGRKVRKKAGTY